MKKYKDNITGFIGTETAKCIYFDGSQEQSLLTGLDNTGRPVEWWFNVTRLEPVEEEE